MTHQNSSETVPHPASGPLLRSAIAVALDRLRAWCRTEGLSFDQPADEDARLWRDLLTFTLDRMDDEAAPLFPVRVLTAESGIKLRKRTWEKHQNWFDRNMRVALHRSLLDQRLPMIFPARASSGFRGHSTKSQSAYFLSFQDFAASPVLELSSAIGRPDVDPTNVTEQLPLNQGISAGRGHVDSTTAEVRGAEDEADAARGRGRTTRPRSQEEADSTATAEFTGPTISPAALSCGLRLLPVLGLSLDSGPALTACVLPLVAALAVAMAISQVGEEISTATALAERVVDAVRDTLAGNVVPSFF